MHGIGYTSVCVSFLQSTHRRRLPSLSTKTIRDAQAFLEAVMISACIMLSNCLFVCLGNTIRDLLHSNMFSKIGSHSYTHLRQAIVAASKCDRI